MPTAENQRTKKVGQRRPPVVPKLVLDSTDGGYEEAMALKAAKEVKAVDLSVPQAPKKPQPVVEGTNGKRVVADLSDLAPSKEEQLELDAMAVSPADKILNFDDPNSTFNKYRKEKNREMAEMLEEKREKLELEQNLKEDEKRVQAFEEREGEDLDERDILKDNEVHRSIGGGKINMKGVSRDDMRETPIEESLDIDNDGFEEMITEEPEEETEDTYEDESDDYMLYADLPVEGKDEMPDDDLDDFYNDEPIEEEIGDAEEFEEEEVEEEEPEPEPEPVKPAPKKKATPKKEAPKPAPKKKPVPVKEVKEPEQNMESPVINEDPEQIIRTKVSFTFDENDLDDLDEDKDDITDEPTDDERLEDLRAQISQKIRPRTTKLNLHGFTIAKKATVTNRIFETKETSAGKWVLPNTGICIQMREISGQKIEYLRENSGTNDPTKTRNALRVIYDHIITPKPSTLEAWTKTIAFADYDHLYMPIYLAAFADANYMPQTCAVEKGKVRRKDTGCGKMFLSDNLNVMDLVKFKDEESKKKFWDLYESDRVNPEGLYVSELVPISDKFAVSFCEPTLYSVLFEMGTFNREFQQKYDTVIAFMPYIDSIYYIDQTNRSLIPVAYKMYENNIAKTNKSKVIKFSNVFDSLTTDEYTNVVSIISAINERNDWMTYQIPEMTCPECKRQIPAEELTASGLVFTRHRLGILANSSIK